MTCRTVQSASAQWHAHLLEGNSCWDLGWHEESTHPSTRRCRKGHHLPLCVLGCWRCRTRRCQPACPTHAVGFRFRACPTFAHMPVPPTAVGRELRLPWRCAPHFRAPHALESAEHAIRHLPPRSPYTPVPAPYAPRAPGCRPRRA